MRTHERRRPRCPKLSPLLEQRIVAFGARPSRPGPAPDRSRAAPSPLGRIAVSANGVWQGSRRGQSGSSWWAGYAAHTSRRVSLSASAILRRSAPGELVGVDCFFLGRLHGSKGAVWQMSAIDVASSYAWAELVRCPRGKPSAVQTSRLVRRVSTVPARWRPGEPPLSAHLGICPH